MRLSLALSAALLGLAAAPAVAASAPHYTITSLPMLGAGGFFSNAYGVNGSGQVVGTAMGSDFITPAVSWSGGAVQQVSSGYAYASAINDSGQIVGAVTGNGAYQPALFSTDAPADVLPVQGAFNAINDAGLAVGYVYEGSQSHAAQYDAAGHLSSIGPSDRNAMANAVNASGLIVGQVEYGASGDAFDPGNLNQHAFAYQDGTFTELGALAGSFATAYSVNDAGVIVGETTYNDDPSLPTHAFSYSNGSWTDLGALDSTSSAAAFSINDAGWIVGASYTASDPDALHATLWLDGAAYDLNSLIDPASGWTLTTANAIGSTGLIVGDGIYDGQERAFLLQLVAPSSVPEPANWALMAGGFALAGAALRRRRAAGQAIRAA